MPVFNLDSLSFSLYDGTSTKTLSSFLKNFQKSSGNPREVVDPGGLMHETQTTSIKHYFKKINQHAQKKLEIKAQKVPTKYSYDYHEYTY